MYLHRMANKSVCTESLCYAACGKLCHKHINTQNKQLLRGTLGAVFLLNDCFLTACVTFWPFQNTPGENNPWELSHYLLL